MSTTRAIEGFDGIRGRNVPKPFSSSISGLFGFAQSSPGSGALAVWAVRAKSGPENDGSGWVPLACALRCAYHDGQPSPGLCGSPGAVSCESPGFAAVAIVTLALGIGANSAIFTVVNAVVMRPLPYANADRLVRVTADFTGLNATDVGLSQPELLDYRDRSGLFEDIAGVWAINANLTEVDQPERVEVLLASPSYFDVLGVRPQLGRLFGPRGQRAGHHRGRSSSATRCGTGASARRRTRSAASCASTTTGTPSSACCRRGSVIPDARS